ncbi:AEL_HP2_G0023660.mRNA.1.CDS.1 [Saccharomyces cerevisiae]|nr:AEL_HP2_G0023660.mRNA.1.CDS.1 [Saccharomyces cerevisiae]CAI6538794.1 AEL_HP2_G0023660.mRNA.1.CDS.1 [Saccharomyces cerevisiae]
MTIAHHCIFLVILAFLELLNVASGSTQACLPVGPRKNGMNINFYEYTKCDITTYLDPEYMGYKYSDRKKLGSVSGKTYLSLYFTSYPYTFYCDPNTAPLGSLFGFYTTPTNVTLEMTGYFKPPQTGSYTFNFATAADSAILSVGGATAFECCAQEQPPITSTNFTINGIKQWHGRLLDNIAGTVYMYTGFYYPMKVVYSNACDTA